MFKWIKIIGVVLVGAFCLARLYYNLTDDFRLANISYEMPNRAEWEVKTPNVDHILSQKFSYIGKGAQSYAFGSEDGKYVIKFFKFKHLRPSVWLDLLPESYSTKQYQRKNRKLEGVFSGYKIAYDLHREDSGLISIHLNKTKGEFPKVILYDKLGLKHTIPLDEVAFILQKRVITARAAIQNSLKNNHIEEAKQHIDKIFALYLSEYQKGIYDNDHGVMRNVGFAEGRPIHLDVGKLKHDESIKEIENYSKDILMMSHRMAGWLYRNEAKHFPELKAHIEGHIRSITGESVPLQLNLND